MPQIPIYNRGLGPTVEIATGQLAPRLQSGVFEQAAASPYEAAQQVLGKVSDAAAAFEVKRQEAERNRFEQQYNQTIDNMAMEFVTSDVSRSVKDYDDKATSYFSKVLKEVDNYKNLPSSVKSALKAQLSSRINLRLSDGRKEAFSRQIEDDAQIYQERITTLSKDWAEAEGQFVGPDNISKQDIILDDMLRVVSQAQEIGLPFSATKEDLIMLAEAERINQIVTLDEMSYNEVDELYNNIRLGRGERYQSMSMKERQDLSAPLAAYLNRMEGSEAVKTQTAAENSISLMILDPANIDEHFATGMAVADRFDQIGRPTAAKELRDKLNATVSTVEVTAGLAFASSAEINEARAAVKAETDAAIASGEDVNIALLKQSTFDTLIQKRTESINEDVGGYVVQNYMAQNDGQRPTPAEMIKIQHQMGVPTFRMSPFTKTELTNLKNILPDLNAQEKIDALNQFFSPFAGQMATLPNGDTIDIYNLAMSDAIAAEVVTPAMNIAMHVGGPGAADILNAEGVDDSELDLEKDDIASINEAVTDEMEDYFSSIIGGEITDGVMERGATDSRINSVLGIRDAVIKLAKVNVALNNMSPEKAAENASQIILSSYTFKDVNDKVLRMPNWTNINTIYGTNLADDIVGVLEQRLTVDFLKDRIVVPETRFGYPGTEEEAAIAYAEDIVKFGSWRTSDDDKGAYLIDAFGNEVRVKKDETGSTVFGPDGQTVVGTRLQLNFAEATNIFKAGKQFETQISSEITDIQQQIQNVILSSVQPGANRNELLREVDRLESNITYLKNMQDGIIPSHPSIAFIDEYFPD